MILAFSPMLMLLAETVPLAVKLLHDTAPEAEMPPPVENPGATTGNELCHMVPSLSRKKL